MSLRRNWQIYRTVQELNRKSEKRNPMFEKNKLALFLILLTLAFYVVYLFVIGLVMLPGILTECFPGMEPYHMLHRGMVVLPTIDFFIRYMFQQTPSQQVKPFSLLPISRDTIIKCYLVKDATRLYNCFWFSMLLPFACVTIFKFYGFSGIIGFLLGWWMLFAINSLFYLLCRTLSKHHILWILLPIATFAALCAVSFCFDFVGRLLIDFGEGFILWNPISFLILILIIGLVFGINIKVQRYFMLDELAGNTKEKSLKKVNTLTFFDRWGEIGEYLKLEVKSAMRNKAIRKMYISALCIVAVFTILLGLSSVYDGISFMSDFIGLYCCTVIGTMTLTGIMGVEGNYIDGLMVRKESIYSLLRAKYYYQCCIAVFPFLIMLVPVFMGKLEIHTLLSYLFATIGLVFPSMFSLAIINKETLSLNNILTASNRNNKYIQMLVSLGSFSVPIIICRSINALTDSNAGYIIMLVAGMASTILHRRWLTFIYHQFMKRRYENLEGFRKTIAN